MNNYIATMEKRLSDEDKSMLRQIYEPRVVAIPLSDSRKDVCIMPDGEIRAYGTVGACKETPAGRPGYLSSYDCGLSWKLHYSKQSMMSAQYFSKYDIFISVISFNTPEKGGTYALLSKTGLDDENPREVLISEKPYGDIFLPRLIDDTSRIYVSAQYMRPDGYYEPVFAYTDDIGESWTNVTLPLPPSHKTVYPNKDKRWRVSSGCEPNVTEISPGKLMMILRTSTDYFYQCFSYDNGETWTTPEKSVFHGTNTTAFLLTLHDGRTVCFWNNTQLLPEMCHKKQYMPYADSIVNGIWEDVFTNRDACHAAVSEDSGTNWKGFRELHLNTIRNNPDFRYIGGCFDSHDKSVHQFQAFELPFGKIIVSVGQNIASRKLLIFDVNWLLESSRTEDFMNGIQDVSTQVYVKSIAGCTWPNKNHSGHCAWNRTNGALLMPDPEDTYEEVLLLTHRHDDRLLTDLQGVTWNFPASKQGTFRTELYLADRRVRISLSDHWFNPCDEYAGMMSQFSFELDGDLLEENKWHTVHVEYDSDAMTADVYIDGECVFAVNSNIYTPVGLSYALIQCISPDNCKGVYVKKLEKL